MTMEDAETSGELVTCNILVHSTHVLSLFDSGASHYFISSNFVTDHDIPHVDTNNKWEISTGNGVITTNKICKECAVEVCIRN